MLVSELVRDCVCIVVVYFCCYFEGHEILKRSVLKKKEKQFIVYLLSVVSFLLDCFNFAVILSLCCYVAVVVVVINILEDSESLVSSYVTYRLGCCCVGLSFVLIAVVVVMVTSCALNLLWSVFAFILEISIGNVSGIIPSP